MTRFTPGGGRGQVRPDARRSTPTSPRCGATRATTCRASRAWGRRPRPSGSASTARSTRWSTGSTRSRARSATTLREHLASVLQNRRLTELVRDVPLERRARPTSPSSRGTATRCTSSSTPCSSGCCASGCSRPSTSAEPEAEDGFDVAERRRARAGERRRAGWRRTPAPAATGLIFRGTWGRGTGELTGIALAAADGHAAFVDVGPDLDAADEQALAAWLADPADAEGRARRQGPAARDLGSAAGSSTGVISDTALAAYLALPGQRSFDLADLALRYLQARAASDAAEPEGQLTLDGSGRARPTSPRRPRTPTSSRPSPSTTSPTRSRPVLGQRGGDAAARRHRAAADPRARRRWSTAASPPTSTTCSELQREFADAVAAAADGGVRRRSAASSTSARPSSCRRCCSTSWAAQDQEDQDRLHHRRRRADLAARADRAPVPRAPAAPPRRHPAAHGRRRAAADGRRRRPHPHDVQADDRRDRPAVLDRPEPAEHPDPHRRGPPDPAGVRRRRRATSR